LLLFALVVSGYSLLPTGSTVIRNALVNESWKLHPALAEPDGRSHRGDKLVADQIADRRVLAELIRRFRQTKPLCLAERDGQTLLLGTNDFERRQEYFLRLLDYFWVSKNRLVGMTRAEVEAIFGPLTYCPVMEGVFLSAGRDSLIIYFADGKVSSAYYAMGY
jgi:hypothetical protein